MAALIILPRITNIYSPELKVLGGSKTMQSAAKATTAALTIYIH